VPYEDFILLGYLFYDATVRSFVRMSATKKLFFLPASYGHLVSSASVGNAIGRRSDSPLLRPN